VNARDQALDLILRWQRSRQFADGLLAEIRDERALTTDLFYGWLRNKSALEFLQDRQAVKPPRPVVAALIQLGLYQLHFAKIPAHAAVHETVALAKEHASPAEVKFVNAVLRRANPSLAAAPPWIRLSHPEWLWNRWVSRYGAEQTEALCQWNNQPPPVYVRGAEPWPGVLEPTPLHPLCYRVIDAPKFFANPGTYYVQDPSTLIAVDVLDPQPGESVLDLCAAPGGKTTYIAQKMQNRGRIIAADSSNVRLGLVAENCRRLGVTIVATVACSSGRCLRGQKFDRVLVDAPCSNTGVMRRRPDLRWRLEEIEITRLAGVQRELLAVAKQLVKPGGVLVYSTCSLEPEENEQIIAPTHATFPPRDGMDGAFVARQQTR
jgi:16S rRNA (cytosine967-C5)-methyltransferase